MVTNVNHDDTTLRARCARSAIRLYDAEIALHIAHQTHVNEWIAAAGDRLHDAVEDHLRAAAALTGSPAHAGR